MSIQGFFFSFLLFSFIFIIICDDIIPIDANPGNPLQNKHNNMEFDNIIDNNEEENEDIPFLILSNGDYTLNYNNYDDDKKEKLYQRLYGWLGEEGVTVSTSLSIKYINDMGHRGIITNNQLNKGDVFIQLPRHVMITSLPPNENDPDDIPFCDLTRRWPHNIIVQLFSTDSNNNKHFSASRQQNILLSLCLIHETKKSGKSFYQPYLDILPVNLSQPLVWKKTSLNQLIGSPILSAVHSAKERLEQDYSIIADILFTHPSQGFTFEHFSWAMLTVSSRAIDLKIPKRKGSIKGLVPIVDMINMGEGFDYPSTELDLRVKDNNIFEFIVDSTIPEKNQVLLRNSICENSLCFLLNHGYIPPSLPHDFIPLNIINQTDHSLLYTSIIEEYISDNTLNKDLFDIKSKIIYQNKFGTIRLGKDYINGLILVFRILCSSNSQIQDILDTRSLESVHSKISNNNENCAIHSLYELLETSISVYPTSLQYDKIFFKRIPNEEKELQLAVKMRIIEKTILSNIIKELETLYPNII